jgi:SAM-dependent methyltransferase
MATSEELRGRARATWAAGDWDRFARVVAPVGARVLERAELEPGLDLLDVGTGSGGNIAIPAALGGAKVVGLDVTPELFEHARRHAADAGVEVEWVEGDAQDLPFEDARFDRVISTFGAMFAPDQQRVADELVRVCRAGGRIGMNNWAPGSMMHEVFAATGRHVPPPPGVQPVFNWGDESKVRGFFDNRVSVKLIPRDITWRFPSPEHMLDYFRTWYGPTKVAFGTLDEAGQEALSKDLLEVYRRHNRANDGTLVAPSAYVEVIAVKR